MNSLKCEYLARDKGSAATSCVCKCLILKINWSGREDLNLRPPRPEKGIRLSY